MDLNRTDFRVGPEADVSIADFDKLALGKPHGERPCPSCFILQLPHLFRSSGLCVDCDPQVGLALPTPKPVEPGKAATNGG